MKIFNAIALVAIVLTASISLMSVQAQEELPEPTQEVTTVPTTEEATEPTQEPTETQEPVTEPPETTEPIIEETEPATEPGVTLYNVPLDQELQLHIIAQAEQYRIDPAIVMAMIWKESRYNRWSCGDGGESLGLMQIQPKWHQNRMDALGCPDLFEPFQNVTVGINILASHRERWGGSIQMALVSYNSGAAGAFNNYFSKGVFSSKYSEAVLQKAEEIRSESYVLHG